MKWMLKNSNGQPDGMFSFATVSFVVVTVVIILSMIKSFTVGSFSMQFEEPNVPLLTLYFGGAFTSYVTRRSLKEKSEKKENNNV
jgi:hypothetical protein